MLSRGRRLQQQPPTVPGFIRAWGLPPPKKKHLKLSPCTNKPLARLVDTQQLSRIRFDSEQCSIPSDWSSAARAQTLPTSLLDARTLKTTATEEQSMTNRRFLKLSTRPSPTPSLHPSLCPLGHASVPSQMTKTIRGAWPLTIAR